MILGFKQCFVPAVVAGTKPHTIRVGQRWRAGMSIQFYQDARQKTMLKFRPDAVATSVQQVRVDRESATYLNQVRTIVWPGIFIDGRELKPVECMMLAQNDGFDTVQELIQFLDNAHGLPFTGQLIHWTDLRY